MWDYTLDRRRFILLDRVVFRAFLPHQKRGFMADKWYYEANREKKGPINEITIKELISHGIIKSHTLLWSDELPAWTKASETAFSPLFVCEPPPIPPINKETVIEQRASHASYVLPSPQMLPPADSARNPTTSTRKTDDTYLWLLAFTPLVVWYINLVISIELGISMGSLWFLYLIANISLSYVDQIHLKKSNHDTSGLFSAWVVPVYIFMRCQKLGPNFVPFAVWCITFLMTLFK